MAQLGTDTTLAVHAPIDLLIVDIGRARCGLPLVAVLEVVPAVAVRTVPATPPWVEGVIDLRGEIVAVINGRHRLGSEPAPVRLSDRLVMIEVHQRRRALRVDAVIDLVAVPAEDVAAAEATPTATTVAGFVRLEDGLVLIQDVDAFLAVEESDELDRAIAGIGDR